MEKLTEGIKFDGMKPRYDLIPPSILHAIAMVLTYGADKYEDRNWEKGIKYGRVFGAMSRHMWAWFRGENIDPESNLPHLWHVACNVAFLVHFTCNPAKYSDLDDRPIADDPAYQEIEFTRYKEKK